jgi:hypothetical protein
MVTALCPYMEFFVNRQHSNMGVGAHVWSSCPKPHFNMKVCSKAAFQYGRQCPYMEVPVVD